ncbi:Rieske 2Fe-2S domain-containing protein [Yinghuangia soli]|uniref:Rieske (2Fe-2S) protein n=1 Tax=Yinghuangia soli TaxID=2908204 RepID=A0AA41U329_9ACTN|nr:Rieske (2Fe-2S) protein [Yinghuangia soli]MCF2529277.1 Rieske (2Fe-2S) protein [Yinghuangia soli]
MGITAITTRLERTRSLDRPAALLQALSGRVPEGRVRDTLHGVPLGHPLHPVLVQVPVGTWASASVLDFVPRTGPASAALIAVGLGAAVPAAAAGAVDLAATGKEQQRVGVAHMVCNSIGLGLYTASLLARLRRRPVRGRLLALAGLAAVGAGGFLGGHLAYRQATGADRTASLRAALDDRWHSLGRLADLPEGKPVEHLIGETALVVVRRSGGADVLAGRCAHLSGPLWEGAADDGCVTCPWHGSTFRLADGAVVRGPATAPQPVFETRVDGGELLARFRPAP